MLLRPRRDQRGPDRFLAAKMAILGIGSFVAVIGFALRIDWLVTIAIFVLVIGLALNVGRHFGKSSDGNTANDEPGS